MSRGTHEGLDRMSDANNDDVAPMATVVWLLPAILLVVAVLPLPYGYYTFLRIVVFLAAGFIAFTTFSHSEQLGFWTVAFALIALLFNPIIPVFLEREMWFVIDLAVAAAFIVYGMAERSKARTGDS